MQVIKYPKPAQWQKIIERPLLNYASVNALVSKVINDIKKKGDEAVRLYSKKFDGFELKNFKVTEAEFKNAESELSPELKSAIKVAYKNIKKFHKQQLEKEKRIETMPGVVCWRKSVGIEKVGLYIPGGSAPLFSTVLMLGVPAVLANCNQVIMCTPCNKQGKINPAILYAAQLVGINHVFKVGGIQAIGAMAHGTKTIPNVYKIFGPGNQYVTAAKQYVNTIGIGIDMPAGPSELLVLADNTANPKYVAADLLSQAEHGPDSQVVLVSCEIDIIQKTIVEIKNQVQKLPRKSIALQALKNSKAILFNDLRQAIDFSNTYAPEHLIIACSNYKKVVNRIKIAVSVFLGNYTPESAGDYASGTNHTLPTNGFARNYSGVSVDSFVRKITFQEISKKGLKNVGKTIEVMAAAEGLEGHKNAVSLRLKDLK